MERRYPREVVASSSILGRADTSVKMDRMDAAELAEHHGIDLLRFVAPSDAEIEEDRDPLRSRRWLIQLQVDLRRHILSLLRRRGLHYKAGCAGKTNGWTHHYG